MGYFMLLFLLWTGHTNEGFIWRIHHPKFCLPTELANTILSRDLSLFPLMAVLPYLRVSLRAFRTTSDLGICEVSRKSLDP